MFRARRMMELNTLCERHTAAPAVEAVSEADAILNDDFLAAITAGDEEATTVLNIADVLAKLEGARLDQDRFGVQVLGGDAGSRGEIVLICPCDPEDEVSEVVRGPWTPVAIDVRLAASAEADEESSEIIRGPWTEPVERHTLHPAELEAAINEADEESSEIIPGPWLADEEATCVYNQEELEALLRR